MKKIKIKSSSLVSQHRPTYTKSGNLSVIDESNAESFEHYVTYPDYYGHEEMKVIDGLISNKSYNHSQSFKKSINKKSVATPSNQPKNKVKTADDFKHFIKFGNRKNHVYKHFSKDNKGKPKKLDLMRLAKDTFILDTKKPETYYGLIVFPEKSVDFNKEMDRYVAMFNDNVSPRLKNKIKNHIKDLMVEKEQSDNNILGLKRFLVKQNVGKDFFCGITYDRGLMKTLLTRLRTCTSNSDYSKNKSKKGLMSLKQSESDIYKLNENSYLVSIRAGLHEDTPKYLSEQLTKMSSSFLDYQKDILNNNFEGIELYYR